MYRQLMMAKTGCYFYLNKHRRSFHTEYLLNKLYY
jgi:hypothetical protein